jgi:hypothetical protein
MDLHEVGWRALTGLFWPRIVTGGGRLWIGCWRFGFHKMRGISWLAEDLLASQTDSARRSKLVSASSKIQGWNCSTRHFPSLPNQVWHAVWGIYGSGSREIPFAICKGDSVLNSCP